MFGLIGKRLSHSFSKEIHEILHSEEYNLIELSQLDSFFQSKRFKGLNVTIPYKQDVIKYLDILSETVKETNSVNTIVNKNGFLYGYNTDYEGLEFLIKYNNIEFKNKVVLIQGNGATSRTVSVLVRNLKAKKIIIAARSPKGNEISFNDIEKFCDVNVLINATPSGMYPNNENELLIDIKQLNQLEAVIDLVYNPLETKLVKEAKQMNITAVNGLMMLVRQAVKSCELFHNQKYPDSITIDIYRKILFNMFNFVLIGMPMSGKTRYSKLLSSKYNKNCVDIDSLITKTFSMSIPRIFEEEGEEAFRIIESEVIMNISKSLSQAISTGGGAILNAKNIYNLKQNGIIIFLDVPLDILKGLNPRNRPLLKDKTVLDDLYNKRYDLYLEYADIVIEKITMDENVILEMIEVKINEYINTKWS